MTFRRTHRTYSNCPCVFCVFVVYCKLQKKFSCQKRRPVPNTQEPENPHPTTPQETTKASNIKKLLRVVAIVFAVTVVVIA